MIHTILFDLDGTLLPMDQDKFIEAYFGALAKKMVEYGYEPKRFLEAVWLGTKAVLGNDGKISNETLFWDTFASLLGDEVRIHEPAFYAFYLNEFQKVKETTQPTPLANACIQLCKEKGYQLILATNPIFPAVATRSRMAWAGLQLDDFIHVTTYENSSFCKPNLAYYQEILSKFDLEPKHCLMVGNDVKEDMIVSELGVSTYLVDECLIGESDDSYPKGSLADFYEYLRTLPCVNGMIG